MSTTPFQDAARDVARRTGDDYVRMQVDCEGARSHAWWRNLVRHGAWEPAGSRVGPPTPEAIPGIAALFSTTEDQVARMIAADWYGVQSEAQASAQAQKIAAVLGTLDQDDLDLVDDLVGRLAKPVKKPLPKKKVLKRSNARVA
ncbi:hypothetical protein [Nocardioides piscis]|uniref:Uncharacterized protein n=1 Tax=Nocardioides piscis TaxID=2714938 RepID=A0A6G7YB35_9ACTN|nr:hypothetical protein [Nocardioides piscis]QIK74114.1 hypothetical protein G7071_00335 [Nocardioides piscis]